MDADLEREMRALIDKQAITEQIYRNARGVDRCDPQLLRDFFHDDATDDHGMFKGTAKDFVPWVMDVLHNMKLTQHMIGNILIELDGETARSETYFIAHHIIEAEKGGVFLDTKEGANQFLVAGGRYLDTWEKRDGAWRCCHRDAVFDWSEEADSNEKWNRPEMNGWAFGDRDGKDASNALFAAANG